MEDPKARAARQRDVVNAAGGGDVVEDNTARAVTALVEQEVGVALPEGGVEVEITVTVEVAGGEAADVSAIDHRREGRRRWR